MTNFCVVTQPLSSGWRPPKNAYPKSILISPTAFKGTLSPSVAARIIRCEMRTLFPRARLAVFPLADGGDGTLEALVSALKGDIRFKKVRGPLGKAIRAAWGYVPRERLAVIEMARASGLALIKGRNRIMEATTFGTGELIREALNAG